MNKTGVPCWVQDVGKTVSKPGVFFGLVIENDETSAVVATTHGLYLQLVHPSRVTLDDTKTAEWHRGHP
jgi:hypothetical protein